MTVTEHYVFSETGGSLISFADLPFRRLQELAGYFYDGFRIAIDDGRREEADYYLSSLSAVVREMERQFAGAQIADTD